ncbi:bifunctional [glutamine synthetase] adenylyltransferase/[glutamine synthetase]-adenylyl-L-tyrosine phosphorylase [Gleimia hominis]|uniref:bifunctional [glutamine synthetase] adenylyltransferase/[glutamine synthetase]-adenylyl-L-tyrosine phosphorylase n=1 Tax=Gleimia hominis TaxID=595468 RepID=UPI000C7F7DD4|nr:bifunctional [glutamine synthetase] adenylyltransferase/[glutamine synthetase]-adenylyl-L-tyrosine phosphorylase [Gleimia hominis]WIK64970.1 bifunctional [glutamine synthetase] adenylyltransferase/[glutamine synthetase]-adenylyl-L-tyrosine phosphorylase [Gleimia hominis]
MESKHSPTTLALTIGFMDPDRAWRQARELARGLEGPSPQQILRWFNVADPDAALLACQRLFDTDPQALRSVLADAQDRDALLTVLGASHALANYIVAHPACMRIGEIPPLPHPRVVPGLEDGAGAGSHESQVPAPEGQALTWVDDTEPAEKMLRWMRKRIEGERKKDPAASGQTLIRRAYWQAMIRIVLEDSQAPDRFEQVATTSATICDLVDATLELALEYAKTRVPECARWAFTIMAMGKTGGQELNYISDVDVLYVYEPAPDTARNPLPGGTTSENNSRGGEAHEHDLCRQLIGHVRTCCSAPGAEPALWTLDAGLRPEGRDGPLARTLASYEQYYRKWAKQWEFQALMKARIGAGNRQLGKRFLQLVSAFVWNIAATTGFVTGVRQMRTRVEHSVPAKRKGTEIKLSPGGLRDVEFSVQLLQLVHGRSDPRLRVRSTLGGLARLAQLGYVARSDAQVFSTCYRTLRVFEHGAQLQAFRRTHQLPAQKKTAHVLARWIWPGNSAGKEVLDEQWNAVRAQVRDLHQRLFYRPIVQTIAQLDEQSVLLSTEGAAQRLQALGYRDPKGVMRHVQSLIAGPSRRATIQRHLLPAMLAWISGGAEPDRGILNFRRLSDTIGGSHWYLALLRDSAHAAQRLARILPTSTYAVEMLMEHPQAVQWLDGNGLEPVDSAALARECFAVMERNADTEDALERVRYIRGREFTRSAIADVSTRIDVGRARTILTVATDVVIEAALLRAQQEVDADIRVCAVAMGRYGGQEASYGSDADVIFVHETSLPPQRGQELATQIVRRTIDLLGRVGRTPSVQLDLDLRPEGRDGTLSRTVEQYAQYWREHARAWERQALLRARPIGDSELAAQMTLALQRPRYEAELQPNDLRTVRLLKARMENERIPRGAVHHLKLGPGGLSDVEWLVQWFQLNYARQYPQLRTTGTLAALEAIEVQELLPADEVQVLRDAWVFGSRLRAANVLASGKTRNLDRLFPGQAEQRMIAQLMGYDLDDYELLANDYLAAARRARAVFTRYFTK